VIGDPKNSKAVFVAHYDTPARSLFPNIMIPKNPLVFYAYQFVPIIFLLIVSLLLSYFIGVVLLNDTNAYILSFLIFYYGIFFLMMKVFKNPCNYNDNTSGVATVLEIIDSLSDDELKNVAFILFDNEEKGKKGSSAYFKDHKDYMADKFVVNFDCVANGDNLIFIAQKDAVDSGEFKNLECSFEKSDEFSLDFCAYKEANSNSDHKNFPKGVGVVACKRSKNGLLYTPYIHTSRDVVASDKNIKYLSQNIIRFIKRL
jgi:hypothetical protein